jgi:tRNA pseudouridine38-40 synthase
VPRYRLTIAYDGADFAGFQLQSRESRARTVQGVMEGSLSVLSAGSPPRIVGAGRTDAGVHAAGQVVSFDLARDWAPRDLRRAMNAVLPRDVRVIEAELAAPDFNARRGAVAKLYRYVLDIGRVQLPARRRYCALLIGSLDEACVREAAAIFIGRKDFASLASSGGATRTTIRDVRRCDVRFDETADIPACRTLTVEILADGFLRKMARSLVGGMIEVGQGRITVADLRQALERRDRRAWPAPAPACGLTLVRVFYEAPDVHDPERNEA